MPRPLVDLQESEYNDQSTEEDSSLARNAARAFAAAVSVLLIATLVISRSGDALTTDGSVSPSAVTAGTISLTDDDSGRALFDLSDMAPNRPVSRCLEIIYDGTILPVDLAMSVETTGDLGPFLDLMIEEGSGGDFQSCDGFVTSNRLYDGTIANLAATGWLDQGRIVNTGTSRNFRITIGLQDEQDALGLTATADFVWEVTPS